MKKLNLFQWVLGAVLVLGLFSCGEDKKDPQSAAKKPTKEIQPQVTSKKHKLSYEFFCPSSATSVTESTGRHSFESDKIEVVLSQYCQALKDETLNNHCAPCERMIKFNEECLALSETEAFQSCEAQNPPTEISPEPQAEQPLPELGRPKLEVEELDHRLARLWIHDSKESSTLSSAEFALRRAYSACGYLQGQPACEDFSSSWKSQIVLDGTTKKTHKFVSQINGFTYEGVVYRQPLLQIIEIDPSGELTRDNTLRVYAVGSPLFAEDLTSFVKAPDLDQLVLELTLVALDQTTALNEISSVQSTKELVQLLDLLVAQMEQREEALLSESLLGVLQIAETDSDFVHQSKLIQVIKSHFELSKPILEKLISLQIKNESLEIKLLGACHSVLLGISAEGDRPLIQQALQYPNFELKRLALKAMQGLELTTADERLIIESISDLSSKDQSFELAKSFTLTTDHIDSLKQLSESSDLSSRQKAVELAGLSSTKASSDFLISLSTETELFGSVFGHLNQRTLSEVQLQKLALGLRHDNPKIRLQIMKLLGQYPSDKVTSHLVSRLSDPDDEVRLLAQSLLADRKMDSASDLALISALENSSKAIRDQAYAIISTRALNDSHVTELEALLDSSEWEARYNAIRLLGTLHSPAATAALIRSLNDPADSLVGISYALLLSRPINPTDINDLARLLESDRPSVRAKAQQLLSQVKNPRALAIMSELKSQKESQDAQ